MAYQYNYQDFFEEGFTGKMLKLAVQYIREYTNEDPLEHITEPAQYEIAFSYAGSSLMKHIRIIKHKKGTVTIYDLLNDWAVQRLFDNKEPKMKLVR